MLTTAKHTVSLQLPVGRASPWLHVAAMSLVNVGHLTSQTVAMFSCQCEQCCSASATGMNHERYHVTRIREFACDKITGTCQDTKWYVNNCIIWWETWPHPQQ